MPLSGPEQLLYEKRGKVVIITINRPERMNALNAEVVDMLAEAWIRFDNDDDAWCAILTGAGARAFSSGADLKDMVQGGGWGRSSSRSRFAFDQAAPERLSSWKPTIAAINGYAIAGGWLLAQRCDIRVASETATFAISEVKWNLPYTHVGELKWQLPLNSLLQVILTGEQISARRLYELGYINYLVPPEKLMEKAMEVAQLICTNAPMAVRKHKEAVYRSLDLTWKEAEQAASILLAPMRWSEDTVEGPRAFVEKRKPVWRNR